MKPGSAGIVVLGMSASFILVLVIMVVLLRPDGRPDRTHLPRDDGRIPEAPGKAAAPPERARPVPPDSTESAAPVPEPPAPAPPTAAERLANLPSPEETTYWKLQQERREVTMLRKEMEARLEEKRQQRKRIIAELAGRCEELPSSEAAQVLLQLDDETLGDVLKQMDSEKAGCVAALLDDLGRKAALKAINGS